MIELVNAQRIFGKGETEIRALNGVNLTINDGEMVAIMGPSGCGKTTLLNVLGCIDKLTDGQYLLDGKDVSHCSNSELSKMRNERLGFVVQDFALINDYTVYQNVALPIRYNGKTSEKLKRPTILSLLQTLGIYEKKDVYPTKLSGGQKQRVAIARALVNNPKIIFADEPTGALDQKNGQDIIRLFKEINQSGKTIVIVTHDLNIAKQCDRIIKLLDGKIIN